MKYQKSSLPYILVLLTLIFGAPVVDSMAEKDLKLQFDINPQENVNTSETYYQIADRLNKYNSTPSNNLNESK